MFQNVPLTASQTTNGGESTQMYHDQSTETGPVDQPGSYTSNGDAGGPEDRGMYETSRLESRGTDDTVQNRGPEHRGMYETSGLESRGTDDTVQNRGPEHRGMYETSGLESRGTDDTVQNRGPEHRGMYETSRLESRGTDEICRFENQGTSVIGDVVQNDQLHSQTLVKEPFTSSWSEQIGEETPLMGTFMSPPELVSDKTPLASSSRLLTQTNDYTANPHSTNISMAQAQYTSSPTVTHPTNTHPKKPKSSPYSQSPSCPTSNSFSEGRSPLSRICDILNPKSILGMQFLPPNVHIPLVPRPRPQNQEEQMLYDQQQWSPYASTVAINPYSIDDRSLPNSAGDFNHHEQTEDDSDFNNY